MINIALFTGAIFVCARIVVCLYDKTSHQRHTQIAMERL